MDIFADRYLNKRNPQEMIQANSAADAAKMEQLQSQVAEYDKLLQDMRKVNLKTIENMEQMKRLLRESLEKVGAAQEGREDASAGIEASLSEIKKQVEELARKEDDTQAKKEALLSEIGKQIEELSKKDDGTQDKDEAFLPEMKKQLEESFKRSDDFIHMENVKVYRNVQASVVDELNKQTDILVQSQKENSAKQKALLPVSVIIMLMVIIDIIVNLFNIVIKL